MTDIPKEDWDWLTEVHGIDTTDAVVVTLHGNEDAPSRVEVFGRDHYQAIPLRTYIGGEGPAMLLAPRAAGYFFTEEQFFELSDIWLKVEPAALSNQMHRVLHEAKITMEYKEPT